MSTQNIFNQLQQVIFGNNIKAIMELRGIGRLTKEALQALGISNRRFYKIMDNIEQPTGPELHRLSIFFECDIKLLYYTNKKDAI